LFYLTLLEAISLYTYLYTDLSNEVFLMDKNKIIVIVVAVVAIITLSIFFSGGLNSGEDQAGEAYRGYKGVSKTQKAAPTSVKVNALGNNVADSNLELKLEAEIVRNNDLFPLMGPDPFGVNHYLLRYKLTSNEPMFGEYGVIKDLDLEIVDGPETTGLMPLELNFSDPETLSCNSDYTVCYSDLVLQYSPFFIQEQIDDGTHYYQNVKEFEPDALDFTGDVLADFGDCIETFSLGEYEDLSSGVFVKVFNADYTCENSDHGVVQDEEEDAESQDEEEDTEFSLYEYDASSADPELICSDAQGNSFSPEDILDVESELDCYEENGVLKCYCDGLNVFAYDFATVDEILCLPNEDSDFSTLEPSLPEFIDLKLAFATCAITFTQIAMHPSNEFCPVLEYEGKLIDFECTSEMKLKFHVTHSLLGAQVEKSVLLTEGHDYALEYDLMGNKALRLGSDSEIIGWQDDRCYCGEKSVFNPEILTILQESEGLNFVNIPSTAESDDDSTVVGGIVPNDAPTITIPGIVGNSEDDEPMGEQDGGDSCGEECFDESICYNIEYNEHDGSFKFTPKADQRS
jgi:hypothetical protein